MSAADRARHNSLSAMNRQAAVKRSSAVGISRANGNTSIKRASAVPNSGKLSARDTGKARQIVEDTPPSATSKSHSDKATCHLRPARADLCLHAKLFWNMLNFAGAALVAARDNSSDEATLGSNAQPDQVAALFVLLLGNNKLKRLDLNHNVVNEEYMFRILASCFALNKSLQTLLMEGERRE